MANREKRKLKEKIKFLHIEGYTLQEIADHEEVNLPGRQWVYYYLKKVRDEEHNTNLEK